MDKQEQMRPAGAAKGGITSIEGLERYTVYGDCHHIDGYEIVAEPDGEYVKYEDVRAAIAAHLARQPKAEQPSDQAEVQRLRKVLVDVRHSLQFANDSPNGGINDTLWMMDDPATVFDFIDAALEENARHLARQAQANPNLRMLAHELSGVIVDVEQGHGFDGTCLDTIKRVRAELLAPVAPAGAQNAQHQAVSLLKRLLDAEFGKPGWPSVYDVEQCIKALQGSDAQNAEAIRNAALEEAAKACESEVVEDSGLPEQENHNYAVNQCAKLIRALQSGTASTKEGGNDA